MPEQLLVEIGCEEIPARLVADLARQLGANLARLLADAGLLQSTAGVNDSPQVLWTPRRLVALHSGVLDRQPDRVEELTGPPVRIGIAADGSFTPQALGFAAKTGVAVDQLIRLPTPKGDYIAARKAIAGLPCAALLKTIIPKAIDEMDLVRSMAWDASGLRFVRPVRWLVVLLGNQLIPVQLGAVKATRSSCGHRSVTPSRFEVATAAEFHRQLHEHGVILSPQERRESIVKASRSALAPLALHLRHNEDLLETVVNLTEFPGVVIGQFDAATLHTLPEEVVVTVMHDHQKYFAVEDTTGHLVPHFVAVTNQVDAARRCPQPSGHPLPAIEATTLSDQRERPESGVEYPPDRDGLMRHGHERVLRARFNDARFFWETDRKQRLEQRLPSLDQVTFQARLGSYLAKSQRIEKLARWLADQWAPCDANVSATAARLSKCDLTTELVKEFPELQGVMGGNFARAEGLPEPVAVAIADQYLPLSTAGVVPRSADAAAVAVADKLDTLAGMFAIGEAPTGSADPLGLRRQGNGIVRILLERELRLDLGAAWEQALQGYSGVNGMRPAPEVVADLGAFISERLAFYLREVDGRAYDTVSAVLAVNANAPIEARRYARDLDAARAEDESGFRAVAAALKRMRNIVRKEGGPEVWGLTPPDPARLADGAEAELYRQVGAVAAIADPRQQLRAIAQLSEPLDRYFREVRVNAEQADLRHNRLAFLAWATAQLSRLADFSEMVVPG